MLTYKQWCVSKRKITQAQRAQIPDIERARQIVQQAIQEVLATPNTHRIKGMVKAEIDHVFNHQPVHFDGLGYVPHWFSRDDITTWGRQLYRQSSRMKNS